MSNSSVDSRPKRSDWTDRLARLASLVGSIIGLIAALGFPSASLQYFRLEVPIQFLSYDRVLRAGVLPAMALILLAFGLFCIGYFAPRQGPRYKRLSSFDFEGTPWSVRLLLYPLMFILISAFAIAFLLVASGTLVWIAYPFVWIARTFGLAIMFGALVGALAIFSIGFVLWSQKTMRRRMSSQERATSSPTAARPDVASAQDRATMDADVEQPEAEPANSDSAEGVPFAGLYQGFMFGVLTLGALFTLRLAFQSWFGLRLNFLSPTLILGVAAAVAVIIYAAFFSQTTIPAFSSHDRTTRLLARTELVIAGLLIYGSFGWLYADLFYENVPQIFGGGRPASISAEISMHELSTDLSVALPTAQCSRQGTSWVCKNLYLVDAGGANWVVADAPESRGHAIVIPQAEFTLIQGPQVAGPK